MNRAEQNIVIVGATSLVAQHVARVYAGRGARLFLVARNAERLNAVACDLALRGAAKVSTLCLDLDRIDSHGPMLREAAGELGGLDVIFVAYGILGDQAAAEEDFSVAEKIIRTNFVGPASIATVCANHLLEQGRGRLAFISSVAGDRGRGSNYVYGASKAGISAFLSGLRGRLYAHGVVVTDIKLGPVDTPMTAHMKKGLLMAAPQAAAAGISRAIDRGADVAYVPAYWRPVMAVLKALPETVFKRLGL